MEQLVDELWPDDPPASARNSVQRFVSDIRHGLGPDRTRLTSSRAGYRLSIESHELDIAIIETQLDDALRAGTHTEQHHAIEALRHAIAALGARLCPGSETLPTVTAEARRFDTLREHAIEKAGDYATALGVDLSDEQERWYSEYPFNERIAGQLMRSMANAGRQRDALHVHQQLRTRLRDELGINPSAEIDQIELDILEQKTAPVLAHTSTVEALAQDTLIGRSGLAAQVVEHLETQRLVTLTGMGGTGKTTLAVHVATALAKRTGPDALPMIARIEGATDLNAVVETVAQAMGLAPSGPERPIARVRDEIARYLATQECLVVIDNAEQVIDDVAEIVRTSIATPGPGRILVTSRERLAVTGECTVRVPPLVLPTDHEDAADSPAVQLFAARGAGLSSLDRSDLLADPASGAICTLVDGLPLAIELAAAQLAIFSPAELEARLAASSHTLGGQRGAPRHASLDHVVEWSWDLLSQSEQRLLAELSLYRSWTTATVDFLEPDGGIRILQSLVDKSLVSVADDNQAGPRFTLLEAVRDFAGRRLNALDTTTQARDRQADWLLQFATSHSLVESMVDASITRGLFRERANLISAIDWLHESGDMHRLIKLLTYSAGSFAHHGPALEIGDYYNNALVDARARFNNGTLSPDAHGAFLTAAADVFHAVGDLEAVVTVGFEAVAVAGEEPFDWAPSANATIAVLLETATLDGRFLSLLEQAEAVAPHTASSSLNQAQVAAWRGIYDLMNRRFDSAEASFRFAIETDPRPGRVLLLAETGLATTLFLQQRFVEARAFGESMTSDPSTDVWHYLVDIISAVTIGGIDPRAGAVRLEASLGPTGASDFMGHVDDARIATGVLAWHNGDPELCRRMLAGRMGRSPVQVALLIEYLGGEPDLGIDDRAWRMRWRNTLGSYFDGIQQPDDSWVMNTVQEITLDHALAQLGLG